MKKWWIIILVLIVLAFAGYFIFGYIQNSGKYQNTLRSELNPSDYHTPGTQIKETAETYVLGADWYRVSILEFSDVTSATAGITSLKETINPGMIGLDKKYVNYKDMNGLNYYFYQSGKNIIIVDMNGDKNLGDVFVIWYCSKYPNK